MAKSSSSISGIAERYAGSLFDLAAEANTLSEVESDLGRFEALLNSSDDLTRLIRSPVFSADEQSKAIGAILTAAASRASPVISCASSQPTAACSRCPP